MWGAAAWGISRGWLDAWGYLIWVPLILVGAAFVFFVGHFMLLWGPHLLLVEIYFAITGKPRPGEASNEPRNRNGLS
jgi:hypothetical protein